MDSKNIYLELLCSKVIKNKYTKWYISIISRALENNKINYSVNLSKNRLYFKQFGYFEAHHIVPKCLCEIKDQRNDIYNYVFLSAKEHFICHLLLTKMFSDKSDLYKVSNAFLGMFKATKNHKRDHLESKSQFYKRIRESIRPNLKGIKKPEGFGVKISKFQRNRKVSPESRLRMSYGRRHGKQIIHPWTGGKASDHMDPQKYENWTQQLKVYGEQLVGELNPFFGKSHSDETNEINKLKHTNVYIILGKYIVIGSAERNKALKELGISNIRQNSSNPDYVQFLCKEWDLINNLITIGNNLKYYRSV